MANYQPPQSLWPRWMHVGCLGCSIVLCLGALATVASLALWVYHETSSPSATLSRARHLPVLSLDNGCVASVRAEGYSATQGVYLPGGRILALAVPTFDIAKIFGTALQGAGKPNAPASAALSFTMPRIVLFDHGSVAELPVPSAENYAPSVLSFSVDDAGAHLVASVTLLEIGPTAYDAGRDRGPSEIWLLDLASRQWTKLLRLQVGQTMRFAAWLPDGSAVLGRPMGQSEDKVTDLWAVDLKGHVRTVARLPGLRLWRVLSDAGGVRLLGFTTGGASSHRIVAADLATGKTTDRPVTDVSGVHPGPLSPDETLLAVNQRVAALDWKAARLRYITWTLSGLGDIRAAKGSAWAFASGISPSGSIHGTNLVAINLADGRAHSVLPSSSDINSVSLLSAAPQGCSFLASTNGYFASPFTPEKSEILEVYADTAVLARSPVLKPEASGKSGSPSSPSQSGAEAAPGGS